MRQWLQDRNLDEQKARKIREFPTEFVKGLTETGCKMMQAECE